MNRERGITSFLLLIYRLSYSILHLNHLYWQWISRYDGDLVAKFYYGNCKLNSKLVFEILDGEGLKRKIEIDSTNISALKLTSPEGRLGTLKIMV